MAKRLRNKSLDHNGDKAAAENRLNALSGALGVADDQNGDVLDTAVTPRAGKEKKVETIRILPMNLMLATITVVGDAGLITNKWSEKAKQAMRDKHGQHAKPARGKRNPEAEYGSSLYMLGTRDDGSTIYGFPSIAFKAAAVDACSHVAGITKVAARGAFHIDCEHVVIEGVPEMREDMVRVGLSKTADLRYRGEFKQWKTTFQVRFNANVLSVEQIFNLFDTAGFAIGVGEWRPQRNGRNGTFHCVGGNAENIKTI